MLSKYVDGDEHSLAFNSPAQPHSNYTVDVETEIKKHIVLLQRCLLAIETYRPFWETLVSMLRRECTA